MKTQSVLLRTLCAVITAYLAATFYGKFQQTVGNPFKVVELHGRGKGLVATRDIIQGELILKEPPLFLVDVSPFQDPNKPVKNAVSSLNSTSRSIYFALSHSSGIDDTKILQDIFKTNAIRINNEASGIFPLVSRINHGCSSAINSVYSWRKEGVLVVHALKPIKRGQELLTAYINTRQPKLKRRAELLEKRGFHCTCSICSLSPGDSRRSDKRITSMDLIQENLERWEQRKLNGVEAVQMAKRLWAIGEKEGYWLGRGKLAEYVMNIAAAHDDEKAVKEWAELAEEWYAYELGEDSEDAKRMAAMSSGPSKHPMWGTRETLRVGGTDMALL